MRKNTKSLERSKMIKRITGLLLMSILTLGTLAGCGNNGQEAAAQAENTTQSAGSASETEGIDTTENVQESDAAEETAEETADTGNVLVVYYSATGNTKEAAELIAEYTDGTLFELVPENDYSDEDLDYTDDNSRVVQEYENEDLRDVALVENTVEDWDSYDTVFIGYPIWWGIAAWPVNDFVSNNDFTDKTVIPFCTSASSGLGDSGTLLEELAGTGEWLDGMRFSSSVNEEEVQEWLKDLNLNIE